MVIWKSGNADRTAGVASVLHPLDEAPDERFVLVETHDVSSSV
jgi:hypothetical protein